MKSTRARLQIVLVVLAVCLLMAGAGYFFKLERLQLNMKWRAFPVIAIAFMVYLSLKEHLKSRLAKSGKVSPRALRVVAESLNGCVFGVTILLSGLLMPSAVSYNSSWLLLVFTAIVAAGYAVIEYACMRIEEKDEARRNGADKSHP